ncbi:hypothetical protein GCM10010321_34080 [Streptomyces chartreusis]|nr:hypothetical protein GCM10010321_34080 [Streptomyces chartreusis]
MRPLVLVLHDREELLVGAALDVEVRVAVDAGGALQELLVAGHAVVEHSPERLRRQPRDGLLLLNGHLDLRHNEVRHRLQEDEVVVLIVVVLDVAERAVHGRGRVRSVVPRGDATIEPLAEPRPEPPEMASFLASSS